MFIDTGLVLRGSGLGPVHGEYEWWSTLEVDEE
jgi:hypothetical protein